MEIDEQQIKKITPHKEPKQQELQTFNSANGKGFLRMIAFPPPSYVAIKGYQLRLSGCISGYKNITIQTCETARSGYIGITCH